MRKFYKRISKILFLILTILFFLENSTYSENRKVILISLNCIRFEDLNVENLKNFNFLFKKGATGIMNVRGRKMDMGSAYLSIGSSCRAIGIKETQFAFNWGEDYFEGKTQDVFLRRTGINLKKENVFNPNILKIKKENEIPDYTINIGLLGSLLHKNKLKTSVFGNCDTEELHREIVCLVMDENGIVDYGDVSRNILKKDKFSPYGVKTDYQKIFLKFKNLKNSADLFLFEIGDTYRLAEYKDFLSEEIFNSKKKETLKEIDNFLGKIIKEMRDFSFLLIVFTPYPGKEATDYNYFLTPVIFYGDKFKEGILTSDTTRNPGIITNLDITPSILSFFKINKQKNIFFGNEVKIKKIENPFKFILNLGRKLFIISVQNTSFLRGIIIYQSISIVVVLLFMLLRLFPAFSTFLIFSSAVLPLSSLFLSLYIQENIYFSILFLVTIAVVLVFLFKMIFRNNLSVFFSICILTYLVLILDTIFSSYFMKYSPIGFSLSAGARYYGIGNEYVGILMTSLIIGITGMEEIYRKKIFEKISLFLFVFTLVIVGHPKLGANVGGFLTLVFSSFITYFEIKYGRIDFKKIFYIILTIAFLLGIFIIIDINLKEQQSHLGRAVLQIKSEGVKVIFQIVYRKLQMNFKLIQWTFWNKILIASLFVLAILYFYPVKFFKILFSEFPYISGGILGVITGSFAGLAFNDSGIIITAVGFFGVAQTILILNLERKILK